LDSGSFTNLEIAGTARGALNGYDAINVSGLFTAGGTLSVSFTSGYTPAGPATFDFFNFTSIGATAFAEVNLPTVAGFTWDTASLLTDGSVSLVASAIPEPSTFAALAGIAALAGVGTRRPRRRAVGF
ncbi:MAG TPA: PEP-CTERM sorting domain-containing protein, partial [Planctomycetia bacterium]|nr:PEP-CTERM sorting domain-containing protein [Planctomycetia bacterium]